MPWGLGLICIYARPKRENTSKQWQNALWFPSLYEISPKRENTGQNSILTKCVMISESLLSRPQVWKHWPKYWHYASWFLSLYELQRSPKVYIAQKVYIVFKLQLFLHPNINYYFFIFSKYSPFSTMPHLFSPLPLFLDFFNLVKKSCF